MECRVRPLRDGNLQALQDFEDYFAAMITEMIDLSHEVMDRATSIRTRYGFKTPDAIHLAAAVSAGCDAFLTNDRRLNRFPDINVITVET
jgi:predicted nucleic acid-binding protein